MRTAWKVVWRRCLRQRLHWLSTQPTNTRRRASSALLASLPHIPGMRVLVPDLQRSWTRKEEGDAKAAECQRMAQLSRRPAPPPSTRPTLLPPAMRLQEKWPAALGARYHCFTFPIVHRPLPRPTWLESRTVPAERPTPSSCCMRKSYCPMRRRPRWRPFPCCISPPAQIKARYHKCPAYPPSA